MASRVEWEGRGVARGGSAAEKGKGTCSLGAKKEILQPTSVMLNA